MRHISIHPKSSRMCILLKPKKRKILMIFNPNIFLCTSDEGKKRIEKRYTFLFTRLLAIAVLLHIINRRIVRKCLAVLVMIPPPVLSSTFPSIQWPLASSLSPPMQYRPLEAMKEFRLAAAAKGAKSVRLDPTHNLVSRLPETIDTLFGKENGDRKCFGIISTALVMLGNGFADEAHDLVLPLSWPEDLHIGFGPPTYSSISPLAQSYATYVHCLVHRREGDHVGEFGMTGWSNANFWSRAVDRSPAFSELPHREWIDQFHRLVDKYQSHETIRHWGERHGLMEPNAVVYNSRAGHELCSRAMKDGSDATLKTFAEEVAETEARVLLGHALEKAGFEGAFDAAMKRRVTSGQAQDEL